MSEVNRLRDKARKLRALADAAGTPGEAQGALAALERVQDRLAKIGAEEEEPEEQRDPFSVPDIYLTEEEKAAVVEVVERYRKMIQADIDARRAVNLDAYYLAYRSEVFRAIDRVRRAKDMDRMYRNGRGF